MARVPVIHSKEQLPASSHAVADAIIGTRGSLEGPFSVWLHAPEWAERVAHLGTLVRFEGTLEFRLRTLAALVVGAEFQAQYVWGAQTGIGRKRNIPEATFKAVAENRSDGIPPDDLQIIDFTRQLLRKHRVEDGLANAVMARLGKDQFVQLTTCIGYYCMLAMAVNACDLEPAPGADVLKM